MEGGRRFLEPAGGEPVVLAITDMFNCSGQRYRQKTRSMLWSNRSEIALRSQVGVRQQLVLNYDTPYIRNLPTRLEITRSSDTETGTEIVGPIYEDPFRIEFDAFHRCIIEGDPPKTSLADSIDDLNLFAEIARAFRS